VFESDIFVLDLFDVAEEEDFAELRLNLFERVVEGGLVVEEKEDVFGCGPAEVVSRASGWSSRKTVREAAMPVRVVRKVLRRMRKTRP
jgi:hypothetical protein